MKRCRIIANSAQTAHPVRIDCLVLVAVPASLLVFDELGASARFSGSG